MQTEQIPKWWFLAHVFLGIISGLVVFILWKKKNKRAATIHLIHSIWIPIVIFVVSISVVIMMDLDSLMFE